MTHYFDVLISKVVLPRSVIRVTKVCGTVSQDPFTKACGTQAFH